MFQGAHNCLFGCVTHISLDRQREHHRKSQTNMNAMNCAQCVCKLSRLSEIAIIVIGFVGCVLAVTVMQPEQFVEIVFRDCSWDDM